MSSKPQVIDISSDSSESSGWTNYFPPIANGPSSSNKKAKGKKVDSSSDFSSFNDSLVSSYHSTSEEDQCESKKGTSEQAESKMVITSNEGVSQKAMGAFASYHVNNNPVGDVPYEGRGQVIGLPNRHTWEVIEAQKWKRIYNPSQTGTSGKGKMG